MNNTVRFIKCNRDEILIDENEGRPKLCGEWGGEQCEGCGADMVHDANAIVGVTVVRCGQCDATYAIHTTTTEATR